MEVAKFLRYILCVNPFLRHVDETNTFTKEKVMDQRKEAGSVEEKPTFLSFGWVPYKWPKINGFAWGYFTPISVHVIAENRIMIVMR